jgi:hypothetical protein
VTILAIGASLLKFRDAQSSLPPSMTYESPLLLTFHRAKFWVALAKALVFLPEMRCPGLG